MLSTAGWEGRAEGGGGPAMLSVGGANQADQGSITSAALKDVNL